MIVTVKGSVESIAQFKRFVTPTAYFNSNLSDEKMTDSLMSQTMKNLQLLILKSSQNGGDDGGDYDSDEDLFAM